MENNTLNTSGKRLEYFIKRLIKTSVNKFGKSIGLDDSSLIYKYIDDKPKLDPEKLKPIIDLYPELNEEWILEGKGEPLKEEIKDNYLRTITICEKCKDKDLLITELRELLNHYKEIISLLKKEVTK